MTTLQVAEGQGTEREMGEAEGYDYVVVGGGVAGTCLAGEVCRNRPNASICEDVDVGRAHVVRAGFSSNTSASNTIRAIVCEFQ